MQRPRRACDDHWRQRHVAFLTPQRRAISADIKDSILLDPRAALLAVERGRLELQTLLSAEPARLATAQGAGVLLALFNLFI